MKRLRNRGLALTLILYLILAITYSLVVPIGRGADEWAHYWYAQFIAEHGRLPVSAAERAAAGYKSDWPPLYHLSVAAITFWIDTAGPPTFKYRQDNLRRHLIPAQGSDAILHTEDELFPWRQEILVWHLGRFLSIGFTLGTLIVTYFIAMEIFSSTTQKSTDTRKYHRLSVITVACLAFMPRFLFTSMLFNYDSLTLLISSLFFWLVIRVAKGHHERWGFMGLGLLAGLALLTKYLTALLPLEIVALLILRGKKKSLRLILQAMVVFIFITSGWFVYLVITFNEIDPYGLVLGTLAPLIRGDGSDRTVDEIFAWLSGDTQNISVPPAPMAQTHYTTWQIVSELPLTFWGNPITRPYPLNWFVMIMTLLAMVAGVGLIRIWRAQPDQRRWLGLLLLHCALPLPLMLIRLFGARDALEAVQGRHILFFAGPAVAILLVWGLFDFGFWILDFRNQSKIQNLKSKIFIALLLTGALSQLIFMQQTYPPLLPVRTTPFAENGFSATNYRMTLDGGATLLHYNITPIDDALKVTFIWQAGERPPLADYQVEVALVDGTGQIRAEWLAYQTQAHYPTRAWESGDFIRDEGWLPLTGLPAGDYKIRWRVGKWGMFTEFKELGNWQVKDPSQNLKNWFFEQTEFLQYPFANLEDFWSNDSGWLLWQAGRVVHYAPTFYEGETIVLRSNSFPYLLPTPKLISPNGLLYSPDNAGASWANFIVKPDWLPSDYRVYITGPSQEPITGKVILNIAKNNRNFQLPSLNQGGKEANFDGQIKLLGYDLPQRKIQTGEGVPLTLYWQGLQWMGEDFIIFSRLVDNQQIVWGERDRLPQENYSTLLWAPGEIVTDGFVVPLKPNIPHGIYTLRLGWYHQIEKQVKSLPLLDGQTGQPTKETAVTIGPIKIGGAPPGLTVDQANPQTAVKVRFDNIIELLGFTPSPESPPFGNKGEDWRGTLYWQALVSPSTDYTVFVHVRNQAGQVVAQYDRPPTGGLYPTSLWEAGEIIKDELNIPLGNLPSGQYQIMIGLYDLATGQRLAMADSPDGAIKLFVIER